MGSLKTQISQKYTKTQICDEKNKRTKNPHSLKARQGHTKYVCKISGSNSKKRRGHWHLREFWVLRLNQPVKVLIVEITVELRVLTYTAKSCEYFSPRASFLFVIRRLFVCGGSRSRRHYSSSKLQQSQPNIFAVTVIVIALGRSLNLPLSQPPPSLSAQLLILLTGDRIDETQSTCNLTRVAL